jgi:TolB-like protein/DNA-binding winged helix-turn-helix (wHTH) protein
MPLSFQFRQPLLFTIFPLRNQFNGAATQMSLDLDLIYSQFNFKMDKLNHHRIYEFEKFRLDAGHLMLYRDDEEIPLAPKAVETLLVLVERRGEILSKDELMEVIWTDSIVEESNLAQYLHLLRKTLGETLGGKPFIETFRRRGYRFNGEVKTVELTAESEPENTNRNLAAFSTRTNGGAVREATSGNVVALAGWRSPAKEEEQTPEADLSTAPETEIPIVAEQRKFSLIAISVFGLLILALGVFAFLRFGLKTSTVGAPIESIAVLPFENASGSADLDYLSDGLSESVIDRLSALPQLKVIARASSFKYRGQNVDLQTTAAQLGVEAIVTGRITQRGDNLLIRVEIINVRENRQLWSEQFNRKATDALVLQEEIARTASEKLRLKLSGEQTQRLAKNYTQNAEAYGLYLRGRFLQNKFNAPNLLKSLEYFQQAVALDPNFAIAYVALAESTGRLAQFRNLPKQDYKQMSRDYAFKAISLDDQLPEARTMLAGVLLASDYDFAGAEREYQRALELNPNYADAYIWRGQLLSSFGRHEEALAEIRRGLELDPVALEANSAYGEALYFARRYDESIAQLKKVLDLDPNYFPARRYLGLNYEMKGDYVARIAESVKINEINGAPQRGIAMQKSFDAGGWQNYLRDNCDDKFDMHPYFVAASCLELGEKDKAFVILEKIYEERGGEFVYLKIDPRLDNLRDDPRYADLLRRVGLQ